MICANCPADCRRCESVSCTCGHRDSDVRPLTTAERHAHALGGHDDVVRPREER